MRNLLILLVLILAALVGGFFWFTASLPRSVEQPDRRTDAIVVLTGGSERLSEGLRLLAAGKAEKLFVSGVHQDVTVKELLALTPDVPAALAELVVLGYEAGNTTGNAAETAAWIRGQGYSSLRLVTAAYHMPRSLLELRRALPEVEIVVHPVFPGTVNQEGWWTSRDSTNLLIGEYLKYLLALVSGPFRSL